MDTRPQFENQNQQLERDAISPDVGNPTPTTHTDELINRTDQLRQALINEIFDRR